MTVRREQLAHALLRVPSSGGRSARVALGAAGSQITIDCVAYPAACEAQRALSLARSRLRGRSGRMGGRNRRVNCPDFVGDTSRTEVSRGRR
jgi:hypothetical protein